MEPMNFHNSDDHQWDQAGRIACEAYELYEKGQMKEALDKLIQAIDLNPSCGAWHFNIGLTLDAMERYEEAIEHYEQALELGGEDVEILNSLAVDCTRTCQYDRALSIFEQIESIDPKHEACYCNRIITYTEMDQHDKAEQMFYMAQQINPDCPICFYNIGNSLFSRGSYERAIWCWKKTAELDPNHPQISYRIAQACWAGGKNEEAREYYLKELRKDPGSIDVIFDFGLFLLDSEDYEGGLEKFNRIIELASTFAPAWFYRGEVMLRRGERHQAEKDYRKAGQLDDKLAGPNFRLAQLKLEAGEVEQGVEYLRSELTLKPEEPDVLLVMGWQSARAGELELACRCFLQILEVDRKDARACYGLGLCMALKKNLDTALKFLNLAVGMDAQNSDYHFATIWLYIHMKKWDIAREELETFRVMFTDDKQIGRAHRELKRRLRLEMWKDSLLNSWAARRLFSGFPSLRNYFA